MMKIKAGLLAIGLLMVGCNIESPGYEDPMPVSEYAGEWEKVAEDLYRFSNEEVTCYTSKVADPLTCEWAYKDTCEGIINE